jgi:hypothetical protein
MKKTINRKNVKTPKMMYNIGGEVTKKDSYEVGDKIKYMDTFRREENDGTIYQINELGTYIVSTGMGVRGVQKEEVIGVYPKEEAKKKRFGLFAKGGKVGMETNLRFYGDNLKYIEHNNKTFKPIYFYEKLADAKKYMEGENKSSNKDYEHIILPYENEKGKCYVIYREVQSGETSMARDGMKVTRDMGDYYEVYDDNSGKTLFIFALTEKEAEEISEEIDFDAFDDGDYISGYEVDTSEDEKYHYNEKRFFFMFKQIGEEDSFAHAQSWGYDYDDAEERARYENDLDEDEWELYSVNKMANGGKFAEGGSIAEGNYHMILSQAKQVKHHVDELQGILKKEDDIEAWVVAKMQDVSSNLSDVTHYLDGKSDMPKAERGMKVKSDRLPTYTIKVDFVDNKDSNFYYNSMEEVFKFVGESATDSQMDKFEEEGYDIDHIFGGEYSTKLVSEIYIPRDERIKSKIVSYLNDKFGKGEVKVSVQESSDINTKMASRGMKVEEVIISPKDIDFVYLRELTPQERKKFFNDRRSFTSLYSWVSKSGDDSTVFFDGKDYVLEQESDNNLDDMEYYYIDIKNLSSLPIPTPIKSKPYKAVSRNQSLNTNDANNQVLKINDINNFITYLKNIQEANIKNGASKSGGANYDISRSIIILETLLDNKKLNRTQEDFIINKINDYEDLFKSKSQAMYDDDYLHLIYFVRSLSDKKYAEGGEVEMAKHGMKVEKIEYPTITLKEYDLNDDQAEIFAYIETRQELQSQYDAIRKNLMTKIARGQFDEKKAPKLFVYLVENGLKLYSKNFGEIKLSKQEKEEIANNMVVDFMSEAELGNYENETFLPKKYLAEDGMFIMSYDIYNEEGDLIESGLEAQDVVAYANMVWYYDMVDEDGEEIDDVDVAIDFLEQSEFNVERNNPKKSSFATKKRKIIRKIKM